MNDTVNIPTFTINQVVFVADFDEFKIYRGVIKKRCFDSDNEQYQYYFNSEATEENIPTDEEDMFKTFAECKKYMIGIVIDTLKEVKELGPNDIEDMEEC